MVKGCFILVFRVLGLLFQEKRMLRGIFLVSVKPVMLLGLYELMLLFQVLFETLKSTGHVLYLLFMVAIQVE